MADESFSPSRNGLCYMYLDIDRFTNHLHAIHHQPYLSHRNTVTELTELGVLFFKKNYLIYHFIVSKLTYSFWISGLQKYNVIHHHLWTSPYSLLFIYNYVLIWLSAQLIPNSSPHFVPPHWQLLLVFDVCFSCLSIVHTVIYICVSVTNILFWLFKAMFLLTRGFVTLIFPSNVLNFIHVNIFKLSSFLRLLLHFIIYIWYFLKVPSWFLLIVITNQDLMIIPLNISLWANQGFY